MALFGRKRTESQKRIDMERLIVERFAAQGASGELVHDPDDPLNTHLRTSTGVWGFGNLMLKLLQQPEKAWRATIDAHVTTMLRPTQSPDLTTPAGRRLLRARIMPAAAEPLSWDYALPFAGDLVEILCIDLPDKVMTVGDEMLVGSDVSELRAIGRLNLQAEGIDEYTEVAKDIMLAEGQSLFVASQVLNPEYVSARIRPGTAGFVVAMPNRHTLLHHVVRGAESVATISRLAGYVWSIDRDTRPGAFLSPHTFYISPEGAQQITHVDADGEMTIRAEGPFLDAINR